MDINLCTMSIHRAETITRAASRNIQKKITVIEELYGPHQTLHLTSVRHWWDSGVRRLQIISFGNIGFVEGRVGH